MSTPPSLHNDLAELMHHIDNGFDVLHRCVLQDAMTQIEDMTGASLGAAHNILHAFFDLRPRRKEQSRVEIALDGDIMPEEFPAIVQRDAPIEPDHVSAGALHKRQESRGVGPKVDHGYVLGFGGF